MNEIAKVTGSDLMVGEDLMNEIADSGILGYSTKAEDRMIPIMAILQDNSGEVKKKHSKHMEGAEPGMIIIRSLNKLFAADSDENALLFQPCGFDHNWVEWQGEPGEGAPVNQFPYEDKPAEAKEVPDPQNADRTITVMPNGNRLVDTRYHFGNLLVDNMTMPVVIAMGGSNHAVSKKWTAQMNYVRLPNGKPAASFFRLYAITTSFNQRGAQSWYNYKITDRGFIGDESLIRDGFRLAMSIRDQEVRAEAMVVDDEAAAGEVVDKEDVPI